MLEPNGRQILNIVGKDNQTKGILLAQDMPAAIAALERAIVQEEAALKQQLETAKATGETLARTDTIGLRQRAVPFIDVLKQCHKAGKELVWGV